MRRRCAQQKSLKSGMMKTARFQGNVMPQMCRRIWVVGVAAGGLIGALLPPWAGAAEASVHVSDRVTSTQAVQIQAVVQAQLKAFAADDAARAFSYATPRIRKVFGNAQTFLEMVRASYPVVYRPSSVSFFKPEKIDRAWVQRAQMSDERGALWQVTYALEMQRDGSWRINGCEVAASEGRVAMRGAQAPRTGA